MGVHIITLDMETAWDSKDYTLSKMGPISYIRDPRFYAQLLSVRVDRGPVQVFEHDEIPLILKAMKLEQSDRVVVGHNLSGFDALILSEIYGIHPRNIWDTIPMARWCGVARMTRESHAALTDWFKHGKKEAGTVVSDGKRTKEDFTPEEWSFFKQYCADDTLQCSENFYSMLPYMTPDALKFMSITACMATEPAFMLDRQALADYIMELDAKAEQARQDISHIFAFSTKEELYKALRSAQTFVSMLNQLGCAAPMKVSETKTEAARKALEDKIAERRMYGTDTTELERKLNNPEDYQVMVPALAKTDLEFLDLLNHPDPRVQQLVAMRLEHNSSGQSSRAKRFYDLSETGKPLPFMLKTFYAHTGRYGAGNSEGASDSINLQNLSKRNPNMLALRKAIKAPQGYKVVAADSSQIEARMVAYLANEVELLEQFRHGRDPYAELAEKIFGATAQEIHDGAKSGDKRMKMYRNVGKTAILSAGYGVGAKRFSDTLLRQGVKLSANLDEHAELAKHAHSVYRMSNAAIVTLWDRCQKVIDALAVGSSGFFAGPHNDLLEYGLMPVPGASDPVPSIKMPNGYILRYPNLHAETVEGSKRPQYFYDRLKGKVLKTKIYGGAMTENCIAKGSMVLTDKGWKPIETITLNDLVYDGVDFVSHSGVVSKGVQDCICVDGIWMTPDHRLLTDEGWQHAKETDVRRLRRCPLRGTVGEGTYPSQLQGHNGTEIREAGGRSTSLLFKWTLALAFSLRLWRYRHSFNTGHYQISTTRMSDNVSDMQKKSNSIQSHTWYVKASDICSMALHEIAVLLQNIPGISTLWRQGYNCMRQMEGFIREFSGRYGANVPAWACAGQDKYQWKLLPGELSLDNVQGEREKQRQCICRDRYNRAIESNGRSAVNDSISYASWMATGDVGYTSKQRKYQIEGIQGTEKIHQEVFDIRDCGPRHRFVLAGTEGPVIAHNCCQSLAFMLLMWQACRMAEQGIHLHGNIHDSFAAIVPAEQAEQTAAVMTKCMSEVPDWLPGFPVACEAEIGDDFMVV